MSDHFCKAGGGWDEKRQEQNGDPDVNFVVTCSADVVTDRDQIRKVVLATIREQKN